MLLEIVLLAVGIGLLVKGSDLLVDAAEKLALAAGVPVLVVGFTLVAAGTSVPELVVDTGAALSGVGELAVGDIVGSNIVDICLVLGIAALFRPVVVNPVVMKLEIPAAIAISLLFMLVAFDGTIGRIDGMILIAAALAYFYLILHRLKKARQPKAERKFAGLTDVALLVAGLVAIIIGGRLTLDAAVNIATAAGISPYLVGLLVVAIGTSLPELATSANASRKGSGDLVLGNCLGSFSFNALVVIGLCALITPLPVPGLLDPIIMTAAAILLVPLIMRGGHMLDRREGLLLIAVYLAYAGYKITTAGI
ncbi:MAG: calcium/sodium antiporter [Methanocella sp.]